MHDPKLSAAVAHNQAHLPESVLDTLSGHHNLRFHGHLAGDPFDLPFYHRHSKALALPRSVFPITSATYPEDVLDISRQRQLMPFFQRIKDVGLTPEMLHYSGTGSAFSDLAAQYRYSDLLQTGRLYDTYQGDHSSAALPLSITTFARRLAGDSEFIFPNHGLSSSSGVVIKDLSSLPAASVPMPVASSSSLSSSSSTRAAEALSLSPLHVSTTVSSSSPLSSSSSPSPHHRSSVSPDTRRSKQTHPPPAAVRPPLLSSLSVPGDVTFMDDRTLSRDRTFPGSAFPNPVVLPPPLWHPSSATTLYGSLPPSLLRVPAPFEYQANMGHLLDHYLSSTGSNLSQHHLHHHLHHHVQDSYYNGNPSGSYLDSRSSPGKELPTKSLKQDRVRDRQDISGALDADREHSERLCNVKKSASTQTQFSSLSCENLPPPPYYTAHDTITHDKLHTSSAPSHSYHHHLPPPPPPLVHYSHNSSSHNSSLPTQSIPPPSQLPSTSHPTSFQPHAPSHAAANRQAVSHTSPSPPTAATPSLPPSLSQVRKSSPHTSQYLPPYPSSPHGCSPPPPPQYTELTRVHVDVQHAPLNLSLSSVPSATAPPTRPSVIASASGSSPTGETDSHRIEANHEETANQRVVSYKNGSSHETAAQVSDEAIEEHFRRSLGNCYGEASSPPKKQAVHVTEKICSVDDHFARALGDQMWTEIKSRSEPQPLDSGTVDAHFAKALGAAMWKKLKADNKLVDDTSSPQQQQLQKPQQLPHELQQQQNQQPTSHSPSSPTPLKTSIVT